MTHALNLIQTSFHYTSREVRTAHDENGEPWFCAKDVFETLTITWNGETSLKNLPENWKGVLKFYTPGGEQSALFINEPGVYRTIFRSNKPEAEHFANWICEDVIPSIRKQGFYGKQPCSPPQRVQIHRAIFVILDKLSTTRDQFVYDALVAQLQDLCALVDLPMPDINRLGQDRFQVKLPGLGQ